MSFYRGCQTITWGDSQRQRMDSVVDVCADAGYDGLEIGFRHLAAMDRAALRDSLQQRNLVLAATHIGGNLLDLRQAAAETKSLGEVLQVMAELNIPTLMFSGLRFENTGKLHDDIRLLNDVARQCADAGRRLLYHNHAFEFDDDRAVMNAILQEGAAELGVCPDVGWVCKGGADPVAFLAEIGGRLGAVHLKDFASGERCGGVDTVCLGTGVVPVVAVIRWLRQSPYDDLWIIAEQDRCRGFPAAAVRQNAAFIKKYLR